MHRRPARDNGSRAGFFWVFSRLLAPISQCTAGLRHTPAWRSTGPSAPCGFAGAASDAEVGAGSGVVTGSGMGDRLLRTRARGVHQSGHGGAPVLGHARPAVPLVLDDDQLAARSGAMQLPGRQRRARDVATAVDEHAGDAGQPRHPAQQAAAR